MKAKVVLWLLALGAAHPPKMAAQPAGAFAVTGDMNARRFFHTATLLTDGRVLIAGGDTIEAAGGIPIPFKALSSAEIYDPGTGVFTPTGSMTTPRGSHTSTLLPNGKVLIAGGGLANQAIGSLADPTLASAELYDPDTGTFSPTGNMTTARSFHSAVLLSNGRVLIAGGLQGPAGGLLAAAELYDPSTGTFTPTGNMTSPWADTATLLPNGKVLFTTGNPEGPPPYLSSAELYDPSLGTFAFVGYLTANHTAPTATLVASGKVLIAGGDVGDGDGASFLAELYDPTAGTSFSAGSLTVGREQHSATLLSDGTVLFAGGHSSIEFAASTEIFDPLKAASTRTGNMHTARELHSATLLNDGRVLIAGGDGESYWFPETILSSAELYTPANVVPAPTLPSLSGDGKGQGAVWHSATGVIASSQNPAGAGEILSMYTTSLAKGGAVPPQVAVGGKLAEILFFAGAPGYPGYFQVNFRMPEGVAPGTAVLVRLNYLGRTSNAVTIGVQ